MPPTLPMQVSNAVERVELLLILCLGEQVVALTSLTFTPQALYMELWNNSTL
jgi:low temperature requirement protein LtrA